MTLVQPSNRIVEQVRALWQTHPPLLLSGLLTVGMAAFFLAGVFLDPRYVTGAPVWLKPLKFAVSVSVYTFTLVWLMGFIEGHRRLVGFLGWTVLGMFALEWVALITQAVRGVRSHFNVATPLDAALFNLMGLAILVLWLATLGVAVLLVRQRFLGRSGRSFGLSVKLGIVITLVGMGLGGLMTAPTARQMADWRAGAPVTFSGAHAVGVEDGGPGLPVVGWSTQGGDLRVGHFVGIHALQALPFVGFLLGRSRRLSERQRSGLVWAAGLGYLGLTLLVTWQALRAQPLLAPDALTLGALAGLAALVIAVSGWALSGAGTRSSALNRKLEDEGAKV